MGGVPTAPAGQRPAAPAPAPQAQQAPPPASPLPGRPGAGGGITVPPLPPVQGATSGPGGARRPLSDEDFEEELDIPEFLRQ